VKRRLIEIRSYRLKPGTAAVLSASSAAIEDFRRSNASAPAL
jgi:hypothetical protein